MGQPQLKPLQAGRSFTFAVLGDNRGDSYGNQYPIFHEILKSVNRDAPAFVFNTGDLINGYEGEGEALLRRQWEGYKRAVAGLRVPIFNVPGNHDVFDSTSARLWKEYQGQFYYSFNYGSALFIALDTESRRNRLSDEQFKWLEKQLEEARNRQVFLFFHKPLFPVDGHVGASLDAHPSERDRLHRLFVKHGKIIKGVFQGHEHLYNFEQRDGVPYYITGGAGAELYVPPELGGFYHYLLVRVEAGKVSTTVKRIPPESAASQKSRPLPSNSLLENWAHSLFWYTWRQPTSKEPTKQYASDGKQGLKVKFDTSLSDWSILYVPLNEPLDLNRYDAISWDVFVPVKLGKRLRAALAINEKYEAPPVILKSGWNRITTPLNSLNLIREARRVGAKQLQWNLSGAGKKLAGWVVFDNLRARFATRRLKPSAGASRQEKPQPLNAGEYQMLESWEGDLLWGASDESVKAEAASGTTFKDKRAVKISFDFSKYKRPAIFASLSQPWDLTGISKLTADVYVPQNIGGKLWISFALSDATVRYKAPPSLLSAGWNQVIIDLESGWAPFKARRSVEQIEWHFSAKNEQLSGWIAFDDLRSGPGKAMKSQR